LEYAKRGAVFLLTVAKKCFRMKTAGDAVSLQCIDAIKISLSIEKEGLAFYRKAAKRARNKSVKELFDKLAGEEEEHIGILQAKEKFLQPAIAGRTAAARQDVDILISRELDGKVFPAWGKTAETSPAESDAQALAIGIESEKRSIRFLSRLLAREKKLEVRVVFSHLVAEEMKHLQALETLRDGIPAPAA
jgi:rubrerythrin